MKKLLMFAAAAAVAVATQAAQFNWGFSQVREGWDDNTVKANGTAYLFLVGSNGATEAAVASAISSAKDATSLGTALSGMAIDTKDMSSGAFSGLTADGITATAPADLFFAVISDDGYAYQGAAVNVTTIETLGSTEVLFGSQKNATSAASAWSNVGGGGSGGGDVPEPTSGLLLLVGGAMLALRRKQK